MRVLSLLLALLLAAAPGVARELRSYAFVNEDGTLRIRGRTIHLHGIVIPGEDRACQTRIRPPTCGHPAALALEFLIGPDFVGCEILGEHPGGGLVGHCEADGVDLSAYLLRRGWAAAAPGAPPEYSVLEKIARERGLGLWGLWRVPGTP